MSGKVRQAVLRILLLTQEFSPAELAEAASLISGQTEDDLLDFLKRLPSKQKSTPSQSEESKTRTNGETRALRELKAVDEEKYNILREFDSAIREGAILKTLDDIRTFVRTISKDFDPGKSRKEALGRLMTLLAEMDIDSIQAVLTKLPSQPNDEENSYHRLANQILSGQHKKSDNSK